MVTYTEMSVSWRARLHSMGQRPLAALARGAARSLLGATLLLPALLHAAVSDVIVWDMIRSTNQMTTTRDSGYSSMTNMRLWWKLSAPGTLGADSTANNRDAKIKGVVQGLSTPDEFGVTRSVATGFNTEDSYLVGNPGFTNGSTADRTYEFWIRNPSKNSSVFFSITQSETGQILSGQEDDLKRMWVDTDGSIKMADRGYTDASGSHVQTTGALTWNANQWYQIVVVFDYQGNNQHIVKVYRGSRANPVQLSLLFNYTAASYGSSTQHWLAIGGHPRSYQGARKDDVGKAGFLGCDGPGTAPVITPETYGALGNGIHDDTYAWRKACAVVGAYGQGTLQLTAGRTYLVGNYHVNSSGNAPHYEYDGLGRIAGARHGKITISGNGATVKLKDDLYVGGYHPVTGAPDSSITSPGVQDPLHLYAAEPGNLLTLETNLEVEVKNLNLDGNIQTQIFGGTYGDAGYQLDQTGIFLDLNDSVWIHDVGSSNNAKDGISIANLVTETDPLKTVLIERATCDSNGRQGLSYNCGNHLEVYDSVFSKAGRVVFNSPGCGVDVEPMGRYMAQGALFDHCKFYDNQAYGLNLLNAPPCIIRDCTLWGTTNYALKVGTSNSIDVDHLFIRCKLYGGYYHSSANRIRFEQCSFLNPDVGDANSAYPNSPVAPRHGIEQVGTGSTILSGCDIQALQTYDAQNPSTKWKSAWVIAGAVLQNCVVTHGSWQGTGTKSAGVYKYSYLANTKFRETSVYANHSSDTYYIEDGDTTSQSAIGPNVTIEGPTAGSQHYIAWGSAGTGNAIPAQTIGTNVTEGVLTPNASAGETQLNTGATYTASPAYTNPVDSTGARLFDGDPVGGGWNNKCGLNWVDQTVTIDLKASRHVRSVKMSFQNTQMPRRVIVKVSDSSTYSDTAPGLGLVRPLEGGFSAPWFDATLPTPLVGRYVHLRFENDADWGWYINEVKVYGTTN